ncbi:hypothetical protein EST38_g12999 [Candolleomyces aberdarensis]|uniref:Uncharacterized protein n=1 Tax=Candolleomyces aberdarensis TaxID=2316362 RepID=A0A4Q2D101_9AGAR|nr:hypothetical protein EST38_g12999 [Candolleomyces aberdarensis]
MGDCLDDEVEHPDNWGSLQEWEPPEDLESSEDLGPPEDWQLACEWELPDDWELLDDWTEYALKSKSGLPRYPTFVKKSELTKSEPWDFKSYKSYKPPRPGTPLSAPDWTSHWLPFLSKLVSSQVRCDNIATMLAEVSAAPDALGQLKILRWEMALSWIPSSNLLGFYFKRNRKSGAIDHDTLHPASRVDVEIYYLRESYRIRCHRFLARGKPLVQDIMGCFEGPTLSEKVWRAISLREGMGIPTRVPSRVDEDGRIQEVDYAFGLDPPTDPDKFWEDLKYYDSVLDAWSRRIRHKGKWIIERLPFV